MIGVGSTVLAKKNVTGTEEARRLRELPTEARLVTGALWDLIHWVVTLSYFFLGFVFFCVGCIVPGVRKMPP